MESERQETLAWLFTTLLTECFRSGKPSIVEEFLPILGDHERRQLLSYLFSEALASRKWWLAEDCLAKGVSLTPREIYVASPLHAAMRFCGDSPDVVSWLLDHGAEIERRDLDCGNSTPLITATGSGLNGVVAILLQRGANANASTIIDDDRTALMVAAETGNLLAAKLLLDHGADITREDRWGRDAAAIANLKGFQEVYQELTEQKTRRRWAGGTAGDG